MPSMSYGGKSVIYLHFHLKKMTVNSFFLILNFFTITNLTYTKKIQQEQQQ